MGFIRHFLALLLSASLVVSVSSWILERTLWDADYLQRQAQEANVYAGLSSVLPKSLAIANSLSPEVAPPPLDPILIREQVKEILPQFIDHLHNGGPAPTINVAEFALATGQPTPAGAPTASLTLGSADAALTSLGQTLHTIGQFAPFVAVVLILLILAISRHRRLTTLARAAFGAAIGLALVAGLMWVMPGFVLQALTKPALVPIQEVLTPFVDLVFHDMARQLGLWAIGLLGGAIGLWFGRGVGPLAGLIRRFSSRRKQQPTPQQ